VRVLEVTYETAAGLVDDFRAQLSQGGFFAAVLGAETLEPLASLKLRLRVEGGATVELAGRLTVASAESLCLELDEASRQKLPACIEPLMLDTRPAGWRLIALLDEKRATAAPLTLDRKIATMSVSEKVQLALHGERDARALLGRERAGVIQASLVRNPKSTLDEMTALARSSLLAPDGAEALARHNSWGESAQIACALCRNARTPMPIAIKLIDQLNPTDLRAVAKGVGVRPQIAQAARKRLGG
jgi:hypothetical protein